MREIKLAWRPPANSKARVSVYKVMMSLAGSSLVKEMYRGTDDRSVWCFTECSLNVH
jgi:hypothetical protein